MIEHMLNMHYEIYYDRQMLNDKQKNKQISQSKPTGHQHITRIFIWIIQVQAIDHWSD